MKKIILLGFSIIFLAIVGVLIYGYYWISDWNEISTKEETEEYTKIVK